MCRLLPALLLLSCDKIDRLLEGNVPPNAILQVSVQPQQVSIARGAVHTLSVSVRRVGDYSGPVAITVDGLPAGMTADLADVATAGQVTSANVTLRVDESTPVRVYIVFIRGHADRIPSGTASLSIMVTPRPDYSLAAAPGVLTIARGGIAPLRVTLARTAFEGPVTLSLAGAAGVTAAFQPNPVEGDTAFATVSVALATQAGTHTLRLIGTADGMTDREVELPVAVTSDAIQLLMDPELHVSQASAVTTGIIVNRAGFSGAVVLSAEHLPQGTTASFHTEGAATSMTVDVGATTPPGSHPVTIRASGSGVADATAEFTLHVAAAGITVTLSPPSLSIVPDGSAAAAITITRAAWAGVVTLEVEALPEGVSAVVEPSQAGEESATLTLTAAASAEPGQYMAGIRATPVGLAPDAVRVVPFGLTVRPSSTGGGNLILDWSRCGPPAWVAGQDGDGPWTRLVPVAGQVVFELRADRGAFAYVEGPGVTVRYLVRSELVPEGFDLCDPGPAPGTKVITGTGNHANAAQEVWTYHLGGGTATSNGAPPGSERDFVIAGVREGVHDLVGFGISARIGTWRGLLRRDVDLPDGGSLGIVDLADPEESFTRAQGALQIAGASQPGGSFSMSLSYLTTAACTVNLLHNLSILWGVPPEWQRPDDYHMLTGRWTTVQTTVSTTDVFHRLGNRTVVLPPAITAAVTSLPGSYRRLEATLAGLSTVFNERVTLAWSGGGRSASVSASPIWLADGPALAMPDLSGVAGWSDGFTVPAGVSGIWSVTARGDNSSGPMCVEGRRVVESQRRGLF